MYNSNHVVLTASQNSPASRVATEVGSTGFLLNREFRTYHELIKTAAASQYYRFTAPVNFILVGINLRLDAGAARAAAVAGATFGGTWTALPVRARNAMSTAPAYTPVCTMETGGTVTGGVETDVIRVRATAAGSGGQSSIVEGGALLQRGLPAGTYAIKVDTITGVADATAVNGIFEMLWEERPEVL